MSTRCCMTGMIASSLCDASPAWCRARPPFAPAGDRARRAWRAARHLVEQEAGAAVATSAGSAPGRRLKSASGSSPPASAARKPRDVELRGQRDRSAQMVALGSFMVGSSSISTSPALTSARPAREWRAPRPVSNGWIDLDAAARDDLAGRRSDDVDRARRTPRPAPRRTAAMMVTAIARPTGDGGVSTISSAAGRNASLVAAARCVARNAMTSARTLRPRAV